MIDMTTVIVDEDCMDPIMDEECPEILEAEYQGKTDSNSPYWMWY